MCRIALSPGFMIPALSKEDADEGGGESRLLRPGDPLVLPSGAHLGMQKCNSKGSKLTRVRGLNRVIVCAG